MASHAPERAAIDPTGASLEAALGDGVCCELGDTGILAVTGNDARTFLHAQFSSSIAQLPAGAATLTSYSDARGRVLAVPRVFADATDGFHLVLPSERIPAVQGQLQKFVLRSAVRLDDGTQTHGVLGLAGQRAADGLRTLLSEPPGTAWETAELNHGGRVVRLPGARPRWLACAPHDDLAAVRQAASTAGAHEGDATAWRLLEIEVGLSNVYEATAEHFVAQMINLDCLGAIDFRKGCYPGQEVIARMHYLGRIKRRMHILRADDAPAAPGSSVYAGENPVGEIVDAAPHPDGGNLALAVLRLEAADGALAVGAADGPAAQAEVPPYDLTPDS